VTLGRKGDYAVRAVLDLARHTDDGRRRKTREIAAATAVPENYLPQILADLVAVGLVASMPGRDGGYTLVRPAPEISLLAVIEAVEGAVELTECVLVNGPCGWDTECAVHRFWSAAQDAFRQQLAATSFADVAAVSRMLAGAR